MNDSHSPNLNPEELADQIDEALSQHTFLSNYPADDPRVDIATRLARANHPQMSPEMFVRVQSRVVAAHRQKIRQRRVWRPQATLYARLAAAMVIVSIFFSATALPALASSVPGDFWYPFKRDLENIEISIAPSSAARAGVYLTQAERRVEEAQVLLQRKIFNTNIMLDARNSLMDFNQLNAQSDHAVPDGEARVAVITESMSILLQEAEQAQVLSGNQVTALLPTIIPILPTDTPTSTPVPSATTPPAEVTEAQPLVVIVATEEPAQAPETDIPAPSVTPSVTPTETVQPPLATMYALENANVRSLPGQNHEVITILHHGVSTAVIGEDDTGKWWHVRLADGTLGWIAKFLLSVNPPPPPAAGAQGSSNGGNAGDNSNGGNAGGNCDHPGNYCNAPGQTGGNSNAGGNGGNQGNGNSNSGGGHKP